MAYRLECRWLDARLHDKIGSAIFETIIVNNNENAATATPMHRAAVKRIDFYRVNARCKAQAASNHIHAPAVSHSDTAARSLNAIQSNTDETLSERKRYGKSNRV